jgi:hypothetical protein
VSGEPLGGPGRPTDQFIPPGLSGFRNAAIGIEVEVETFPIFEMLRRLKRPREPWDIGLWGWIADTADPSDFVAPLYAPVGSDPDYVFPGAFSDAALGRRLRAALSITDTTARARLRGSRRRLRARRGSRAVRRERHHRLHLRPDRCQVHQPIYGISLGSLCMRRQRASVP